MPTSLLRPVRLLAPYIFAGMCLLALTAVLYGEARAQSFSPVTLTDVSITSPTSLDWGPDGRLYVSQQDGAIQILNVQETAPGQLEVTSQETLTLIQGIINHDDDGSVAESKWQGLRQVTGIVLTSLPSDPTIPVLYVGSSDPRIGAGNGQKDKNLDTNSGIITRLTYDPVSDSWIELDIVRGLPRSEENHSTNGLDLSADGSTLYIAQGGHTNAGAPSANFAYTTEYILSAAILTVDLNAIEALPTQVDANGRAFKYNLPTLNDPTRSDVAGAVDGYTEANDPFGGNDGLNQAKLTPDSPVQIYSPGWRNAYDLVVTQAGRLWAVDNGANAGWGGHPIGEADYPTDPGGDPVGGCTNEYDPLEPGSSSTGPGGDPKVNNKDGLHLVTQGYYAGHPAPVRGNVDSGLYLNDTFYATGDPNLPSDWDARMPAANPIECDYRSAGEADGALVTWPNKSVNGTTEYIAQGDLNGDLLFASLNDGSIYRVALDTNGETVLSNTVFASGYTAPLDVTVTGDDTPFPGYVWVATYGNGGSVNVLVPNEALVCNGTYDNTIDEDKDGYTNADEIDNGADPCSGANVPRNNDAADEQQAINAGQATFLLSDLNDPDDDNDGAADVSDPFQVDAANGADRSIPLFYDLFLGTINTNLAGGVGFTGLMTNGTDDYLTQFDAGNLLTGGATGQFSIVNTADGLPDGSLNNHTNGFQFGVAPTGTPFEVTVGTVPNYFNGSPQDGYEQGIYVGTGTQDDYLRVTLASESEFNAFGTQGGIKVVHEEGGTATTSRYPVAGLVGITQAITFSLLVDPIAGTIQPGYALDDGAVQAVGAPVAVSGALLDVIRGSYTLAGGLPSQLAVGVFASSGDSGTPFQADFETIRIEEGTLSAAAYLAVSPNTGINTSTFATGSFSITNTSTGGEKITNLTLDVSDSQISDVVYDPDGTAGDVTAKALTPDSGTLETGFASGTFDKFQNGVDSDDGYQRLTLSFTDFDPGETFTFSMDLDPNSIKGTVTPGPGESGSIAGVELSGSNATVSFDNGATLASTVFKQLTTTTKVGGGEALFQTGRPATVSVTPSAGTSPVTTSSPTASVILSGPPDATVRLMKMEAGLFEQAGGGYNLSDGDVNSAVLVEETTHTLGASGQIEVDVALTKTTPESGVNLFSAVAVDENGVSGNVTAPVVYLYDGSGVDPGDGDTGAGPFAALYRVNSGSSTPYTDLYGQTWEPDNYVTNGKTYEAQDIIEIANTNDDDLYRSERFGRFEYSFPVSNGVYSINLHFAEIFWGVKKEPAVGSRIFSVSVEGQEVITNLDIAAEVGPATAMVRTLENIDVSDGALDISFSLVENKAKVSGIEVYGGDGTTPTKYTLATSVQGSGTITKNPEETSHTSGTTVELTATPDAGWVFQEWTGDVASTDNPVSTQVFGNMSVTAVFAEEVVTPEYAVNTTVVGSGTVTKSPDQSTYTDGSTVALAAAPAAGWYFTGWSGDATGTTNPLTLTVNAELNIEASFAELPTAEAFRSTLQIADAAGRAVTRTFGADGAATAGFDAGLDVQAPPAPPSGAFDARFTSGTSPLNTDLRPSVTYPSSTTWDLAVQGSDAPITIAWNPSFLPAGTMTMATGAGTVNMKTQASATITAAPATLTITYAPYDPATQATPTYAASAGWTLWGLPYDVGGTPYETVLPLATPGSLIGFNGTYETLPALALGRGQWVNFSAAGDQTFDGFPATSVTLDLAAGWNLVSGPNCSATLPASISTAYVYENGSYTSVTTTEPFQGVWMLAGAPETVTLDCTSSSLLASKASTKPSRPSVDPVATISIRDANGAGQTLLVSRPVEDPVMAAFALPPVPPKGAFDARFEGDSRLAVETTSRIRLQSSAYPLTVHVEGTLDGTRIKSEAGGQRVSEQMVTSGQTFPITDPSVDALSFEMSEYALEELPDAFSLKYNYPNPFRGATTLVFDLPEPATVEVEVYNVLGQRVMSGTYDEMAPRRDQQIAIDGSRLASGVYFYRVTARLSGRTVSDTGKMVLVR